jgi:uncharacterized protein YhaN
LTKATRSVWSEGGMPSIPLAMAEMSEGTQFQLYLALRLAYLDEYAQKAEPMPFIGDDLLAKL